MFIVAAGCAGLGSRARDISDRPPRTNQIVAAISIAHHHHPHKLCVVQASVRRRHLEHFPVDFITPKQIVLNIVKHGMAA